MTSTTTTLEETSMEVIARLNRDEARDAHSKAPDRFAAFRTAMVDLEARASSSFSKGARRRVLELAGPALLVLTFLEDGLRVPLSWSEQHEYLTERQHLLPILASIFLVFSCVTQLVGAFFVLFQRFNRVKAGSYGLLTFAAIQPVAYGTHTDLDFVARSLTLIGGFLLLIWGENQRLGKAQADIMTMRSLAEINTPSSKLQLVGRLMLTLLFFVQALFSEHGGMHTVVTAPGVLNMLLASTLVALSLMVCIGFKTEWSSFGMAMMLGFSAVWLYPFWWQKNHGIADFHRYYFFQTMSCAGGMLLLTLHGPGGLSLDGQKKQM
eukprot:CAMPEP_0115859444 /NCGR_PEP_ID=MMETSP0287-20121206/16618_1 /TAXON_ID=412157 /ORGANISM="Chrysochromulina rotalis, Strain UIO044" /LENGTH=322 /DNA_ID=CAMNT_0003313743 /DNA_START=71 /DNA_END=1039 /DNA_ORIENTATION=+